jgi:hypothetical protein
MEKKTRKLPVRPTGDTVEIKGVQYNVLLRRIPDTPIVRPNRSKRSEDRKVSNVGNRRQTQSNAPDENATKHKETKGKKGVTPNNGTTSTRTKKVKK